MKRARVLTAIGWREWVALPELGIEQIKVKVDTGARSSALHASNVDFFTRDGQRWVRFEIHPIQRDTSTTAHGEARLIDQRSVRNSGGRSEQRIVVRTSLRILNETWPIELTLSKRDNMGFRMLLGREAIRGHFVVDASRSFLGNPRPQRSTVARARKNRASAT